MILSFSTSGTKLLGYFLFKYMADGVTVLSLGLKTLKHETSALIFDLISLAPTAAMFIIFVLILVKLKEEK